MNHIVKQLRAALGDDANAPRYIEPYPASATALLHRSISSRRGEELGGRRVGQDRNGWRGPLAGPRAVRAAASVLAIAALLSCSCRGLATRARCCRLTPRSRSSPSTWRMWTASRNTSGSAWPMPSSPVSRREERFESVPWRPRGRTTRDRPTSEPWDGRCGPTTSSRAPCAVPAGVIGRSSSCCTPQRGEPSGAARRCRRIQSHQPRSSGFGTRRLGIPGQRHTRARPHRGPAGFSGVPPGAGSPRAAHGGGNARGGRRIRTGTCRGHQVCAGACGPCQSQRANVHPLCR